jgi:hypothetical protein
MNNHKEHKERKERKERPGYSALFFAVFAIFVAQLLAQRLMNSLTRPEDGTNRLTDAWN